jgi:hypothetical protein
LLKIAQAEWRLELGLHFERTVGLETVKKLVDRTFQYFDRQNLGRHYGQWPNERAFVCAVVEHLESNTTFTPWSSSMMIARRLPT